MDGTNTKKGRGKGLRAWTKGHKKLTALICIAVVAVGGFLIARAVSSSGTKVSETTETAVVEKRDLVQRLTLSGTVESGTAYSATSTLTDVEIKQVNVKVGDHVQEGDIIAVLDDSTLRDNVDSASKSLKSAKKKNAQDISTAERNLKNAKEDKKVQTSRASETANTATANYNAAVQELANLQNSLSAANVTAASCKTKLNDAETAAAEVNKEIARIQALIDACEARIAELKEELVSPISDQAAAEKRTELDNKYKERDNLNTELTKYKTSEPAASLLSALSAATTEYNNAAAAVTDYEAKVKTANENVATLKSTMKSAVEAYEDAKRTTSRTVTESSETLKNTQNNASDNLDSPRKELKKAQKDLKASQVVAQADGIVTAVNAKPGDKYKGEAIAVVHDDSSYRVSATADQYDISSLAVGQEADITIAAADMTDTEGSLIYVGRTPIVSESGSTSTDSSSSSSSSAAANYRVETYIKDPSDNLRIGMNAKVVVTVWEKKDCLAVPDEYIGTDENGKNYVNVVSDNGRIRKVEVEYGMQTDYYSEISGKGIEEGVKVAMPDSTGDDSSDTEGTAETE